LPITLTWTEVMISKLDKNHDVSHKVHVSLGH